MGIISPSHVHAQPALLSVAVGSIFIYTAVWFIGTVYNAFFGPLSKYPGPRLNSLTKFPLLSNVYAGNEVAYHKKLHDRYGSIVRTAPQIVSVLGDAQAWKDLHGFQKAGGQLPHKDLRFYSLAVNGVPSLINSNDETHARQRKILSHAFSDSALKEQEPLLKRWAELFLQKLTAMADGRQKVDMLKMLNCTTFDIMSDLTFAEPLYMLENSSYSPWVKATFLSLKRNTIFRCIRTLHPQIKRAFDGAVPWFPAVRRKLLLHWKFTVERVDKRLAMTPDRPDLWSRILEKSKSANTGGLTVQEQYSNAALFMLAGTETTATALSGTLFYISTRPQVLQALKAEVHEAFNAFDDLHLNPLSRCTYMDAVLREALRMYPPLPIGVPRIVPTGGATISGHFLPAGTGVSIPQTVTYHSEQNWVEPETFAPERWLGDAKYDGDNKGSFEPFSVGPRNCLGKNLAWHEMRLLFATMLLHFDFEICEESKTWADQKVWLLWEKPSLWCTLRPAAKAPALAQEVKA